MTAVERLDEIDALVAAATEGPWETTERPGCVRRVSTSMTIALCGPAHGGPADATFIAAARTDVPALAAALRAVLDLHAPKAPASAWDMVSWTSCSCGAMEVTSRVDGAPSVAPAEYPCPTVRAITAALDGAL